MKSCSYALGFAGLPLMKSHGLVSPPAPATKREPWVEAGPQGRGRIGALRFICHPGSLSVSVRGQATDTFGLGGHWKPAGLVLVGMRGEETNAIGLACIPLAASPTDPPCKTSQADLVFPAYICLKAATTWLLLYKAAAVTLRMRLTAFSAKVKTWAVLRCKTNRRELTCAVLLFESASVPTCFDLILRVFWRHSFPWKPLNKSFLLSFCFQIKFGEP